MAIYYCDFKVYSRPKSAVAGAAYASRSRLYDERLKKFHDYRDRSDLVWSSIMAPQNAPAWVYDREKLWNGVEKREDLSPKRDTAQVVRRMVAAIPRELTPEQRVRLVERFVREQFVAEGMVADANIHNDLAEDGGEQPHLHLDLTMRDIGPDGFGNKRRDWNDVDFGNKAGAKKAPPRALDGGFLQRRRELWSVYCNQALEDAGSEARIDHRSYKDQGVNKRPTVPHGLAKRMKNPNERMKARIEHNRQVGILNEELVRLGIGIGLGIERGNLAMTVGSIAGEAVGHELSKHIVQPALHAAQRILHLGPQR